LLIWVAASGGDAGVTRNDGGRPNLEFAERADWILGLVDSRPSNGSLHARRTKRKKEAMKALVYHGPQQRSWDDVADPTIQAQTDAIVKVDTATICGTDLHILKGDVPAVKPGTILGHEAVGTVVETGTAVTNFQVGDKVLVSCITSCGKCRFCKEGRYGQCTGGGGWIFGHLINGLQAEYARVPFADNSLYKVPAGMTDEQVLFLSDILPTAFEVGVLNGGVQPGDTVAIVGAGPIGLAAVMTAKLFTPGRIVVIDLADSRLVKAKEFGADVTINNAHEDAVKIVYELTAGLGADVAVEAVGVPDTFELAAELIRPGGTLANVGVHGKPATLHLEKLWIRDVTVKTGLVDTRTIPQLLSLIAGGRLDPTVMATHRFPIAEAMAAYDVFTAAAATQALKVVLEGTPTPVGGPPKVPIATSA
jgi:alcohol dehydrogenase